jgi:hypothetical protein
MATMNGTIKRVVSDKGFGFLAAGDRNEYFFHRALGQIRAVIGPTGVDGERGERS